MKRFVDWNTRLFRFIESRRCAPFAYGKMDCCLFVADVIREMTGVDVATGFRDTYGTRFGAARVVFQHGGSVASLVERVLGAHGLQEIEPVVAWRGDVALVADGLGVFAGLVIFAPGLSGLVAVDRRCSVRAWRV